MPLLLDGVARRLADRVVRSRGGREVTEELLAARVARWWVPDNVVFVAEIPKTATGKFSKLQLKASVLKG